MKSVDGCAPPGRPQSSWAVLQNAVASGPFGVGFVSIDRFRSDGSWRLRDLWLPIHFGHPGDEGKQLSTLPEVRMLFFNYGSAFNTILPKKLTPKLSNLGVLPATCN